MRGYAAQPMASAVHADLLGTWTEDTSRPDAESDDDEAGDDDRYETQMLHVLVLSRDDKGQPVARYGWIDESNHGTSELYGEGTFQRTKGGLVVELRLSDWVNTGGMGENYRHSLVRACRLEFRRTGRGAAITLMSHLEPGSPRFPEARFVRETDTSLADEILEELAERGRRRLAPPEVVGGG